MRTCSLLIASPNAGFLPRIAQRMKLPTSVWNSVAPLSSSAANARASVIGATGFPVCGFRSECRLFAEDRAEDEIADQRVELGSATLELGGECPRQRHRGHGLPGLRVPI